MTTLDLTFMAIAPLSDPSDVLLLKQSGEIIDTATRGGVRVYAGGRRRAVSRPGDSVTLQISFVYMDKADFLMLQDLLGVPVLVRDQRARRVAGIFFSITGQEPRNRDDRMNDVSLSLQQLSWSEVV